jgi:hypothetical protein
MHFGHRHSQLLPFCEYVFAPGKSPVEVQPEILHILFLRELHAAYMGWRRLGGECDMDLFGSVSFYSPF